LDAAFYCPPSRRALYAQLAMDGAKKALLSPDALHKYFQTLIDIIQSTPSPFISTIDETRLSCLTLSVSHKVIVSTKIVPGCVEIPQVQDAQLTLVAAISAFSDSTVPTFITKLKTVDKHGLGEEMLLDRHQYYSICKQDVYY
jgi:hypothetical protein